MYEAPCALTRRVNCTDVWAELARLMALLLLLLSLCVSLCVVAVSPLRHIHDSQRDLRKRCLSRKGLSH